MYFSACYNEPFENLILNGFWHHEDLLANFIHIFVLCQSGLKLNFCQNFVPVCLKALDFRIPSGKNILQGSLDFMDILVEGQGFPIEAIDLRFDK